jgi:hypothetical protein
MQQIIFWLLMSYLTPTALLWAFYCHLDYREDGTSSTWELLRVAAEWPLWLFRGIRDAVLTADNSVHEQELED